MNDKINMDGTIAGSVNAFVVKGRPTEKIECAHPSGAPAFTPGF